MNVEYSLKESIIGYDYNKLTEKMESLIKNHISNERLGPYLYRSKNNYIEAMKLYEININYSSELYKLLSILEISLRNLVNERCIKLFGDDWMTNIKYDIHHVMMDKIIKNRTTTEKTRLGTEKIFFIQEDIINDTIRRLREDHKPITNGYMVSRSVFGFWTNLFNKAYENILWDKSLTNIFNRQFTRNKIEHILNEFRWLRNRIAHNGCVIDMKYSPVEYYNKITDFMRIMDPILSYWARGQVDSMLFKS